MYKFVYTVADGQRVLVGLTHEETTEFELLTAKTPMHGRPPRDDELRWLELLNKHEAAIARQAA